MLIKGSITAVFFWIFELFLKYSGSFETHNEFPRREIFLIENVKNVTNVDEAKTQCARHDAILASLHEVPYTISLFLFIASKEGKLMKRAFCCKKI